MNRKKQLTIPSFISDGLILQRKKELKIWGWDIPLTDITITFNKETYYNQSDSDGYFEVEIGSHSAGGPYEMTIQGSETISIKDIYIGEVWLAGGQSNMELTVERVYDSFRDEIDASEFPYIRQFQVPDLYDFNKPHENMSEGLWISAEHETIQNFSAVAYFFAKKLYQQIKVPIGIYHTAKGGTRIEAWMSEPTLRDFEIFNDEIDAVKDTSKIDDRMTNDALRIDDWYKTLKESDIGLSTNKPWYSKDLALDEWDDLTLPAMFEQTELNNFIGAIWFRNKFYLNEDEYEDNNLELWLGTLVDSDDTYVNGVHVGRTDHRYPPRKYKLNKNHLNIGKNEITVRLEVSSSNGGFIPEKFYGLKGSNFSIPLQKEWKYKVGYKLEDPLEPEVFFQYKPVGFYNGVLYPLRNIQLKGIIFYQGESNTGEPEIYSQLFKRMIKDWRELWGAETPFYFVQLANYLDPVAPTEDRMWADLRNQQMVVNEEVPNTGIVSAIDVGVSNELHPPDKKTLGERLANWALTKQYGRNIHYDHPQAIKAILATETIQIKIQSLVGDLVIEKGLTPDLEIISDNGEILHVEVGVHENTLIIKKPTDVKITSIQYAWKNNPKGLLVDDATKFPLLPFKFIFNN